MAQAGSNDEKHWGSKISLDCPFNAQLLGATEVRKSKSLLNDLYLCIGQETDQAQEDWHVRKVPQVIENGIHAIIEE